MKVWSKENQLNLERPFKLRIFLHSGSDDENDEEDEEEEETTLKEVVLNFSDFEKR